MVSNVFPHILDVQRSLMSRMSGAKYTHICHKGDSGEIQISREVTVRDILPIFGAT